MSASDIVHIIWAGAWALVVVILAWHAGKSIF